VDVGQDTALRDDDAAEQTVELLVLQSQRERRATTTHVADGELEVTRDDARLLVVAGGVAGELEDLGREVLEDGGEVDGRAGTDTLSVVAWRVSGARASADGPLRRRRWIRPTGNERPALDERDVCLVSPPALPPVLPPALPPF